MNEKKSVVKATGMRYKRATKKQKGTILNEFVKLTGYTRVYARYVLRYTKKPQNTGCIAKERINTYDHKALKSLKEIWYIMDFMCGKRFAPALKEVIPILEKYEEISLEKEVRKKLLTISPATIDRLLSGERRKFQLKGKSNTKPGTLLKHQIPIRTFSDWDDKRPGFLEFDLVGHDGGNSRGDFMQTLDGTDISTGWTETQGVRNKAQKWVFLAIEDIRNRLPFKLLGIDSDNGSEFINHELFRYCEQNKITFTRSRSSKKNDNCFVEQKNYSVVRRAVGYLRYDTEEELSILNKLYQHLRLYTNFFLPAMKLLKKTRIGSKVSKTYDQPKTPYRRILESSEISDKYKQKLKAEYSNLNPAFLKREITKLQNVLFDIATKKNIPQEIIKPYTKKDETYNIKNNQKTYPLSRRS